MEHMSLEWFDELLVALEDANARGQRNDRATLGLIAEMPERLLIRLTDFWGKIFPGYLGASSGSPPTASMIVRSPCRTLADNAGQASITR